MGWLAGNNWLWLLLAAVLGALVTVLLTLRKATVVTESVETATTRGGVPDAADGAAASGVGASGVGAAGTGAVAVGAAGVGAAGVGAVATGSRDEDVPPAGALDAPDAADVSDAPDTLTAEEAGWAPEPEAEPIEEGAGISAGGAGAAGAGVVGVGAVGAGALASDRAEEGEAERSFAPPAEPVVDEPEAVQPKADALSADEAGWAPVSAPEAAGWAPADDEPAADEAAVDEPAVDEPAVDEPAVEEPVADEPAVDEAAVEVPEAVDAGYRGSHAAAVGDPLSDPLTDPSAEAAAPEVDGEPALFADAAPAEAEAEAEASASAGAVAGGAAVAAGAFGAGSADPLADGSAPGEGFTVKGNADSMKFHTAESPYFGRTKAEVWFDSEESARGAGFHRWDEKDADAAPATLAAVPEGAFGKGSADPLADGSAPGEGFTVKGNADSMKFHTAESPYFGRTKAEVWFDSEESARGAGFHRWDEKAEPAALAAIPDGAYGPGSADPGENGDSPGAAYTVKGNVDSMLFHDTDSPYYSRTKAEVWFDSAETARNAGFAAWNDK